MDSIKRIKEAAAVDIEHLYKEARTFNFRTASKIKYDTAREMALSWGVLTLREIEVIEHDVNSTN